MNTDTPIAKNSESSMLNEFKSSHTQEIQEIAQILMKITNLSEETVNPHVDAMLLELVKSKVERPFYETATPSEWVKAFREWADSHRRDTPMLSDYAVSRAGIYEEDEQV
jgi:hypothetical protein